MKTRKRTSETTIEMAVLGAAMRDEKSYVGLAKIIRKPDVFHTYANQCVWKALAKMHHDGLPIEPVGIADTLTRMKLIEDVQHSYLIDLWQAAPATAVDHHARTLVELFQKRQTLAWASAIAEQLEDPAAAPVSILEQAKADLDKLTALGFAGDDGAADDDNPGFAPFPVECLPNSLQDFILSGAEALYCDPAFLAVPALVSIGAAIGNSKVIALKETWVEPSVFWAAIVADSSSMKSPSMSLAIAPLWSIQRELSLAYEDHLRTWKYDVEQWNSRRYQERKGNQKDGVYDRAPDKPNPKKLLVNDITIERLAQVMHQNPQGVCLSRDELSGWFGSFGRYSDGNGPGADLSTWLEIFRAQEMLIDRKTGDPPSLYIRRAACSVIGTIQPKVLQSLLGTDSFECGLASRLLLCMPKRKPKVWTEDVVPQSIYDTYSNNIKEIYLDGEATMKAYGDGPKQVTFTKKGKEAWTEFYAEWADRQTHSVGEQAYALAKLEAYCARFALLICCYNKADFPGKREEVNEGHVRNAFTLVKWFAREAERVYAMVRAPAEKRSTEQLTDFILAIGGNVTPRRLMRSNPSKYPSAEVATRVLEQLAEKGLGKWVTVKGDGPNAKPLRALEIHPTPDTT